MMLDASGFMLSGLSRVQVAAPRPPPSNVTEYCTEVLAGPSHKEIFQGLGPGMPALCCGIPDED